MTSWVVSRRWAFWLAFCYRQADSRERERESSESVVVTQGMRSLRNPSALSLSFFYFRCAWLSFPSLSSRSRIKWFEPSKQALSAVKCLN